MTCVPIYKKVLFCTLWLHILISKCEGRLDQKHSLSSRVFKKFCDLDSCLLIKAVETRVDWAHKLQRGFMMCVCLCKREPSDSGFVPLSEDTQEH